MEIKVLRNFKCNGVRKKAGEMLSKDEQEKMGEEFLKEHFKNDFLILNSKKSPFEDEENEDSNENNNDSDNDSDDDSDLDEMNKEELLAKAKELGLDPHGRTGEEKLREMILEKMTE